MVKTIDQLQLSGKRVFCRVDFNVPLKGGNVGDNSRIVASLPTIKYILDAGGHLICASHLGRPKGKPSAEFDMAPVGKELERLLKEHYGARYTVRVTQSPVGEGTTKAVREMGPNDVVLLQNLRFDPGEEKNAPAFAKALAALADVYVNDAFGTAHRAHASTVGMAEILPEKAAGFLMMREIAALSRLINDPSKPFVAVLGGAKVSDKIGVLESLAGKVDALMIGGAMASTFIKALGGQVGKSKVEEDHLETARKIAEAAKARRVDLVLPSDVVAAESLDATEARVVPANAVEANLMALDVGPLTRETFRAKIMTAKRIFWNGPLGVFEKPIFAEGTMSIARAVAASAAFSVVGGGDSLAAAKKSGVADKISHLSTGGGASLEFVEGLKLPGIAVLGG